MFDLEILMMKQDEGSYYFFCEMLVGLFCHKIIFNVGVASLITIYPNNKNANLVLQNVF